MSGAGEPGRIVRRRGPASPGGARRSRFATPASRRADADRRRAAPAVRAPAAVEGLPARRAARGRLLLRPPAGPGRSAGRRSAPARGWPPSTLPPARSSWRTGRSLRFDRLVLATGSRNRPPRRAGDGPRRGVRPPDAWTTRRRSGRRRSRAARGGRRDGVHRVGGRRVAAVARCGGHCHACTATRRSTACSARRSAASWRPSTRSTASGCCPGRDSRRSRALPAASLSAALTEDGRTSRVRPGGRRRRRRAERRAGRAAGLEVGDGVVVDEWCRTSAPNVFAAGDVAAFPLAGPVGTCGSSTSSTP